MGLVKPLATSPTAHSYSPWWDLPSLNLSVSAAITIYTLRQQELVADAPGNLSPDEQAAIMTDWIGRSDQDKHQAARITIDRRVKRSRHFVKMLIIHRVPAKMKFYEWQVSGAMEYAVACLDFWAPIENPVMTVVVQH